MKRIYTTLILIQNMADEADLRPAGADVRAQEPLQQPYLAYADPKPNVSLTKYLMMPVWNFDEGEKLPYVKVLFHGRFPRPEGHLQTLKICAKITPSAAGLCGLPKSKPRES